jgi:hypothetical protein
VEDIKVIIECWDHKGNSTPFRSIVEDVEVQQTRAGYEIFVCMVDKWPKIQANFNSEYELEISIDNNDKNYFHNICILNLPKLYKDHYYSYTTHVDVEKNQAFISLIDKKLLEGNRIVCRQANPTFELYESFKRLKIWSE